MIQINYQDKRPIYEQVVDRFKQLIVKGVLKPEDKLPSVRTLAIDLSINPNTIQKAYQELERLGFIYTVKGRGNFVAESTGWISDTASQCMERFRQAVRELHALGISQDEMMDVIRKEVN